MKVTLFKIFLFYCISGFVLASTFKSFANQEQYNFAGNIENIEYSVKEVAQIYHASMAYIFSQQPLINSVSENKDKLFGRKFIEEIKATYNVMFNQPFPSEDNEYVRRLINLMMLVMEDNRTLLLDKDIGFKGFIPAIFAFQLSERFKERGFGISIKFTNFPERIRNNLSSPDLWEQSALKALSSKQVKYVLNSSTEYKGQAAVRYMRPVTLTPMCLSCHGIPQDNPINKNLDESQWYLKDKTGFMMEGWKLGELGGGISVSIYEQKRAKYVPK